MRIRPLARPVAARAAWWAFRAARDARDQLEYGGLDALALRSPPRLPADGLYGVKAVLRVRRERCLVRSAVFQAWHAGQGTRRDLVIGVTAPGGSFTAHAWLDGEFATGFTEITRRPPALRGDVRDRG